MSLVKMWLINDEEQPYFRIRDVADTLYSGGEIREVPDSLLREFEATRPNVPVALYWKLVEFWSVSDVGSSWVEALRTRYLGVPSTWVVVDTIDLTQLIEMAEKLRTAMDEVVVEGAHLDCWCIGAEGHNEDCPIRIVQEALDWKPGEQNG